MEKLTEKGGVVRVFYALLTLAVSIGIAFFVYQNVFTENSKYPFKLGLDLAGGSQLVYEADVSGVNPAEVDELMNVLRQVIERRINVFGVSEPVVQVERSSFVTGEPKQRLVVELPGVTDVNQAVAEIGRTPLLEFKLVDEEAAAEAALLESIEMEGATVTAAGGEAEPYVDTGLTGRYLVSSQLQFVGQNSGGGLSNEPVVSITWNEEGAKLFEEITAANVGRQLAIFLDGELISSPNINERISGGQAIISGGFTPDEARDLAQNLNFGALPVPIQLASTQTVGSTLGAEVLEKGMMAGTIGFGLVIVFMLLWYRLPGLVAIVSLLTYVVVMLALFQFIPVVLTAAGLAGFILTIGMAVDANVLVFERMKEEYREGKSFREAASVGFQRAWSAIRDGNVTSLLSAVILFWFGTSMVKGFALVFGIGVLTSMISALIVTRTLLLALPDKKKGEGLLAKLYETGLGKPPHQSS
ncbi:MAG: protein translocase subunit SecD [Candidatus Paceibacterota bacterium]